MSSTFVFISICWIYLFETLVNGYPSDDQTKQCINYCSSNALCLIVDNSPRCYCFPEWEGEGCDLIRRYHRKSPIRIEEMSRSILRNTPCSYIPDLCKNNGVCYLDDNTKLACKCPYPYDGTRCTEYSVCYNYCFNNGVCEVKNEDDSTKKEPTCKCEDNFEGTRCQVLKTTTAGTTTTTTTTTDSTTTDIICTYLPDGYCNTGFCVVNNNRAVCQCPSTHTGDQCQNPTGITQSPIQTILPTIPGQTSAPGVINGKTCAQNPCQNNRPCYNNGNTYFCYCGSTYSGVNCEFIQG